MASLEQATWASGSGPSLAAACSSSESYLEYCKDTQKAQGYRYDDVISVIRPWLCVGGRPGTANAVTSLLEFESDGRRITHIINCVQSDEEPAIQNKFAPDGRILKLGLEDDGDDQCMREMLPKVEAFVRAARQQDPDSVLVYVHCMSGVNRAPSVAATVLIAEESCTALEALSEIRDKRPAIRPKYVKEVAFYEERKLGVGSSSIPALRDGLDSGELARRYYSLKNDHSRATMMVHEDARRYDEDRPVKGGAAVTADASGAANASAPSAAALTSVSPTESREPSAQPKVIRVVARRPEHIGIRLVLLSDTHDFQDGMKYELPQADILVHAGDFTCRGTRDECSAFQSWMESLLEAGTVKHVVVIAGNHELSFHDPASRSKHAAVIKAQEKIKADLVNVSGLTYLEDSGCEVCGLKFFGSPWTLPVKGKCDWAFQARDLPGEDGIGKYFELIPRDVDVLITHSPPFGQGDEPAQPGTTNGAGHGGSRVLLKRVLEVQPTMHVFGHYHEGHGITTHEDASTLFVNAAICDEDYHPDQSPILIEFVNEGDPELLRLAYNLA